jgi:DNA-binding response OmpR family regulator
MWIFGRSTLEENDIVLLMVFCKYEGRNLGADYLSEQVFRKEATDGGAAVTKHIYALRDKMRGSGYAVTERCGVYEGRFCCMEYIFARSGWDSHRKRRNKL